MPRELAGVSWSGAAVGGQHFLIGAARVSLRGVVSGVAGKPAGSWSDREQGGTWIDFAGLQVAGVSDREAVVKAGELALADCT